MVQVSSIIVGWVPQDSGRVASIQIQSRVSGSAQWTEEAAAFDASVGTFRFASNAPATDIDVRARYRMTSGVYGAWFSASIRSAGVAIKYTDVTGTPTKLADVNALEGGKLTGIAPGADVTKDNTSKDTAAVGGTPAATVISNINSAKTVADQAKIAADAAKQATDYQTGTVQPAVDQAIADANSRITTERDRAVGKEGELSTRIEQIAAQANGPYDDTAVRALISDERTARVDADGALADRASTLEAQFRGDTTSALLARVKTVESATTDGRFSTAQRASEISTVANDAQSRVGTIETSISRGDFATSQRASTIEAQLRGDTSSGLRARIEGTETAISDGRFASAQSVSNLSAQIPSGLSATINDLKAVTSNGTFATASSVSSLNSQINGSGGLAATVTNTASTAADAYNRTRAYVASTAVAGGNRAQIAIYADSNGGAGVDIIGDTRFMGSLAVQSAATGGRTEITNAGIRVYDTNNVLRAIMGFF